MNAGQRLGVVIVAAGSGVRFGATDKALALLGGSPLVAWSLELFAAVPQTHEIIIVAGQHTWERCEALIAERHLPRAQVVRGGSTRADSVRSGLQALSSACTLVAVHDAARPLATTLLTRRVIDAAAESGAAIPVVPVSDTLHAVSSEGTIESTLDRSLVRAAQTPQVARRDWLENAYSVTGGTTDEGGMLHAAGYPVVLVDGDMRNLKITWPADLAWAEAILAFGVEDQ